MFKNNYLAITTRKMRDGTKRENCFAVKLPKDMKVLRKQFGEDISNSSLTSKIYKNGSIGYFLQCIYIYNCYCIREWNIATELKYN